MTFDDWFKEKYKATYDNPQMKEINNYCRDFTASIWNAAIESAQGMLEEFDSNESCLYPDQVIEILKVK